MTLFDLTVGDMMNESILGRAQERDIIRIEAHQIRDYTLNKQKQVDDYPYGGGHGAVMLLTPFNADATDEATVNFVTKYQELYGETPNQFAADAYDCVYAYKMALEAAGCTPDMSNEELCDALIATFPTITLTGLTGDGAGITWDASGEVSKSPKGMVIENGAYVGMD